MIFGYLFFGLIINSYYYLLIIIKLANKVNKFILSIHGESSCLALNGSFYYSPSITM